MLETDKNSLVYSFKARILKDTGKPDEIRQSKIDKDVFLYYKQYDRLYCVVVRHAGMAGFLITAYPTDKVKEGDVIWTK